MNFTVEDLEFYLLVLVRISSFVVAAPFFNYQTIPAKWKAVVSMVLAIIAIQAIPAVEVEYTGIIGFSGLLLKECAVGLILGFMCNICMYIVSFAGQLIDMVLGF